MNFDTIIQLYLNNPFINFGITYSLTALLDFVINAINRKKDEEEKEDYAIQFFNWLSESIINTCDKLNIKIRKNDILKRIVECYYGQYEKKSYNLDSLISEIINLKINSEFKTEFAELCIKNLAKGKYAYLRNYYMIKSQIFKDSDSLTVLEELNKNDYDIKFFLESYDNELFWSNINNITLKNLYVSNMISFAGQKENDEITIEKFLDEFCFGNKFGKYLESITKFFCEKPSVLIITGSMGSGKTSCLSKLAYKYYHNNYMQNLIFLNLENYKNKLDNIFNFIQEKDLENKKTIIVLDGLDEVINNLEQCRIFLETFSYEICKRNIKAIITSRTGTISLPSNVCMEVSLNNFNYANAVEWLKNFKKQKNDFVLQEWLTNINELDEKLKKIILNPLILYICVIRNIKINAIGNIENLYDIIFSADNGLVFQPRYKKGTNLSIKEWRKIREIAIEIALKKFNNDNNVIEATNSFNENLIGFGIVTYKLNGNNCLKFVHASIWEYFVADKIYQIFRNIKNDEKDFLNDLNDILNEHHNISESILDFFAYFVKRDCFTFPFVEKITNILLECIKYSYPNNYIYRAYNMINCFYILALKCYNVTNTKNDLAKQLYEYSHDVFKLCCNFFTKNPLNIFYKAFFDNCYVENINFANSYFVASILRKSTFSFCNFDNSNINSTYADNSNFYFSSFQFCNLKNADFSNSVMNNCCFKDAKLNGAIFENADLTNCDFRGANIQKTNFSNANLKNITIDFEQMEYIRIEDAIYYKINVFYDGICLSEEELKIKYKEKYKIRYAFWSKEML